jgi:hypothetical protein
MGVYTIKDLDKTLPSVASINQMQVKEYVQALVDESLIRCEKIGSGNWYWCFMSDAKNSKENQINALKSEKRKLVEAINEMEKGIKEERAKQKEDEEMLEVGGVGRNELLETHEALVREMEGLDRELALYCDNDPAEVVRKIEETKKLKMAAMKWTDNIESMESYLFKVTGDREQSAGIMLQACGDEYVAGEGLKELYGP